MIREYRVSDLDQVLRVWQAAAELAHPFLSDAFQQQERRNIAELFLPRAETWVWESDGRVAGFISLLGNQVGGVFVAPDAHGRGIGRALMDHARELRGELEVEVFEANTAGRAFYASYGFVQTATRVHQATGFKLLRLRLAAQPE